MKQFFLLLWFCLLTAVVFPQVSGNAPARSYQTGELVDVYDPIEKAWFPSSVLKTEPGKYFIHYTNYDPKWDTWVTPERVRPAGSGKKNDPAPGMGNATNNGTGNSNAAVSANAGPDALPIIYWKDKSLVFRIGDPVIYDYKGVKTVFTIANIDYNGTYKGMQAYGYNEADIDLNKVELVTEHSYNHYPPAAQNGTGDVFKEGDKVEVLNRYDQFSAYKWEKGIIVSVDGDNYYVYSPGTTRDAAMEYFWHHASDVRAIGSNKTTHIPPQYARENTNPNKATYLQMMKSASCPAGSDWYFMWFYRHDIDPLHGHDPVNVFNNDNFKKMLEGYDCMYDVRKDYTDIGLDGSEINQRFDIQWEFLQKREEYIGTGLKRITAGKFYTLLLDVKKLKYTEALAKFKGLDDLKKDFLYETKKYQECAALAGVTIEYPWDQLEKAYQEAVQKFMSEGLETYKGLRIAENSYTSKDAKAETVATKFLMQLFPGSKILASGTEADFYVNKNSIGIPTERTKAVVFLHQNPGYRTCILTRLYYREDYSGGGAYGAGYIYDQETGNYFLKSCK